MYFMGGSRGRVASGSAAWEFEARWTRFSGLNKGRNLWVRHSPKLRREVRFTRDVDYWHWLLIEADPEIAVFCEEPMPRNRVDAKVPALADVWLMRTDGAIEFRSVARSDKQVSSIARFLQEAFGEGVTHRALSKEEVGVLGTMERKVRLSVCYLWNKNVRLLDQCRSYRYYP